MIDINQFDTSSISDVAYISDVYADLLSNKHWLVQLLYCFNKFDNKNFYCLCNKLNYNAGELTQAFRVITRKT